MRTILFASLVFAEFLFAKPFIVFPEQPVDYGFAKPRSQISTSDNQHLICELTPPDVDNSEHSFVTIGVQNTFPATSAPQNFSISSEIPKNSFTQGTNSLRIAERHIQPVFNFSPDAKSATKKTIMNTPTYFLSNSTTI